jgi:hypothetical protein
MTQQHTYSTDNPEAVATYLRIIGARQAVSAGAES